MKKFQISFNSQGRKSYFFNFFSKFYGVWCGGSPGAEPHDLIRTVGTSFYVAAPTLGSWTWTQQVPNVCASYSC
jgi:hypothetical protein